MAPETAGPCGGRSGRARACARRIEGGPLLHGGVRQGYAQVTRYRGGKGGRPARRGVAHAARALLHPLRAGATRHRQGAVARGTGVRVGARRGRPCRAGAALRGERRGAPVPRQTASRGVATCLLIATVRVSEERGYAPGWAAGSSSSSSSRPRAPQVCLEATSLWTSVTPRNRRGRLQGGRQSTSPCPRSLLRSR